MKRLNLIVMAALLAAMMFPSMASATGSFSADSNATRVTQGFAVKILFEAAVDSVDTLTSNAFSLADYDMESFSTYPISYGKILTSTLGTPKVTAIIQGSFDASNWFTVDTLDTNQTSEAYARGTLDFNNIKCPLYRLYVQGIATNRTDTVYDIVFYIYRPRDSY